MVRPMTPLIQLRGVSKRYPMGSSEFAAVRQIDLEVAAGEFVVVCGRSGSGKTTLLNLMAGIDRSTEGDVVVADTHLGRLSESQSARWRGRTIGLIFQFFQLLPTLTVAENVVLAMDFVDILPRQGRRGRARELLDRVGIADRSDQRPASLSGGQQQRAAVARALANDPPILLGDEPTGNLDSVTSAELLTLFAELNADGKTVVLVSHDPAVEAIARRRLELADGRWVSSS